MIKFEFQSMILWKKRHIFNIQIRQILPTWWPQIWPDLCQRWQRRCLDEDGLFLRADYAHKSVIILTWKTRGRRRKTERQTGRKTETEISGLWWRWRRWWREEGEEITESSPGRTHPHLSQALHIQSPLADVHSQTPEGERSARGHGVPPRGRVLLNPSVHTHTIPILIPHAPLTSLLKHRSKSPDWSQRLRNKWRQIPDFCMASSAGRHERAAACRIWQFHLCKYIPILEMWFPTVHMVFWGKVGGAVWVVRSLQATGDISTIATRTNNTCCVREDRLNESDDVQPWKIIQRRIFSSFLSGSCYYLRLHPVL